MRHLQSAKLSWFCLVLGCATIAHFISVAVAQENSPAVNHAAVLAPFLGDDSFAVSFIDVTAIDAPAAVTAITTLFGLPVQEQQQATVAASMVKSVLDGLRGAGVRYIYVVGGLGDIHARGGPIAVVPLDPRTRDNVQVQIQTLVGTLQAATGGGGKPMVKFERHPSGVLMVGSVSAVDRYALRASTDRADLTTPLARLATDGASVGAVFATGADARRVVRELWPTLPAPLTGLTARMAADRWKHVEVSSKLSSRPSVNIALEATDVEAASAFHQTIQEIRKAIPQFPKREPAEMLRIALDASNLRAEGTRIVANFSTEGEAIAHLRTALVQTLDDSRAKSRRNLRMNNFMQIMLGMLNYEASKRTFPPAAIHDAEGRPLLSWRVAILPHLGPEAFELYKQFRLNEPWDSPHNIVFVQRMPKVFADPDPKLAELARAGKTTFQVPVGPETIFYKKEGTTVREITDGLSHTLALIEVVPERAVEWTKPADWQVDLQNPLDGVRRPDRDVFTTGWGDGHAEAMRNDIDPALFRACLTRGGGEVLKN